MLPPARTAQRLHLRLLVGDAVQPAAPVRQREPAIGVATRAGDVDAGHQPWCRSLAPPRSRCSLGSGWQGTLVWLSAYTLLAVARASRLLKRPRVSSVLEGLTGIVLVGLGLRLAAEPASP